MNQKNYGLRSGNTLYTEVSNDKSAVFNIPSEIKRQINIDPELHPFKSPEYKRYTEKSFTKKLMTGLTKVSGKSKTIKKSR